jgi:hypothetical protein
MRAAADRGNLFKTFSKVFFQKRGRLATFMAKWSMQYPGQSGHCHFSFWDNAGKSLFFDGSVAAGISNVQRHALGGLRRYLPEFIALVAPTINSYTRLVKGAWAPTAYTWGIENRTAAIRAIPGSAKSQRLECCVSGQMPIHICGRGHHWRCAACVVERLEPVSLWLATHDDVADRLVGAERFPQRCARRRTLRGISAARRSLVTHSSNIMLRAGRGSRASTNALSTTGSSTDTSRSSDDANWHSQTDSVALSFRRSMATIRPCSARC